MSVLPANLEAWEQSAEPARARSVPLWTPKSQVLLTFLVLVALAAPSERAIGPLLWNLVSAVAAACLLDAPFLRAEGTRWRFPTSALLTGLIVAMILAPGGSLFEPAAASAIAILGKRWLTNGREQIFNPAALGLLAAGLIFGGGQSWWGALANLPAPWSLALLFSGALIVDRLNKFPLVLVFAAAYFGLWTAASLLDPATAAEMFRSPFLEAALFFALFMLTDPPTSPNRYGEQVAFGLLAAVASFAAQLLGAGQTFLLVGLLIANACLAAHRIGQRRRAQAV